MPYIYINIYIYIFIYYLYIYTKSAYRQLLLNMIT